VSEPTRLKDELGARINRHNAKSRGKKAQDLFLCNQVFAQELLALIKTTIEDCLPEKEEIDPLTDPDYRYVVGYNSAIDQTRDNLNKLMETQL
jgi:hypothetical protein